MWCWHTQERKMRSSECGVKQECVGQWLEKGLESGEDVNIGMLLNPLEGAADFGNYAKRQTILLSVSNLCAPHWVKKYVDFPFKEYYRLLTVYLANVRRFYSACSYHNCRQVHRRYRQGNVEKVQQVQQDTKVVNKLEYKKNTVGTCYCLIYDNPSMLSIYCY